MKKINVFLRLSKKSHPLYEELWKYPPENVKYIKSNKVVHYSIKESSKRKLRNLLWHTFLNIAIPIIPLFRKDCDLIHSTNSLSLISNKPWIVDAEAGHGLVGLKHWKARSFIYRFFIKKVLRQKNCKKVTVFSEIAKKSFLHFFGEEFEDKVETIYPAQHISKQKIKKRKKTTLLFIARRFEDKGGYETLEAFNKLRKDHKCRLIIVSCLPENIVRQYSKDKDIELVEGNLPKEELLKYYQNADIFVYPSRIDANFGTVLIEAMANKLPIVTNNLYAVPEVVKDGKNGFLIKPLIKLHNLEGKPLWKSDPKYLLKYREIYENNMNIREKHIQEIVKKLSILIKNLKLRKKMREYGFKLVSEGKFSIKERNKKLRRIYEEALKK